MTTKVINLKRKPIIESCALKSLGFNYQIDPYVGCEHHCHYCYAQNQPGLDWENEIGICSNIKELAEELSLLTPQTIYIGMKTDPYQPLEKEYKQTREALKLLKERGFSVCILTKSNLVIRDIDLLSGMAGASVGISVAFQDDDSRSLFEANTLPNSDRIQAIAELKKNGIETYALICPVMPYITEVEALIAETRPVADTIWIYPLEMKYEEDTNWKKIEPILQQHFPGIIKRFREIVFSSGHAYWQELRQQLENIRINDNINLIIDV